MGHVFCDHCSCQHYTFHKYYLNDNESVTGPICGGVGLYLGRCCWMSCSEGSMPVVFFSIASFLCIFLVNIHSLINSHSLLLTASVAKLKKGPGSGKYGWLTLKGKIKIKIR